MASGLNAPMLETAPSGDGRIFIPERTGAIRILENGSVNPSPFLTISGVSVCGEGGSLGLAFHPDFASNGRFFVHCTASHRHRSTRLVDIVPDRQLHLWVRRRWRRGTLCDVVQRHRLSDRPGVVGRPSVGWECHPAGRTDEKQRSGNAPRVPTALDVDRRWDSRRSQKTEERPPLSMCFDDVRTTL